MKKTEIAMAESKEVIWDYLNDLRESGAVNMFGAGPYLMDQFGLNKYQARDALLDWMKNGYRNV
jgi:hypothetical protein